MKITIEISPAEWSSVQEAKAAESWQSDEYAVKRIFQHGVSREAQLRNYKTKLLANGDKWERAIAANLEADAPYR